MHVHGTVALFLIRHHANKNNTKIICLVSYAALYSHAAGCSSSSHWLLIDHQEGAVLGMSAKAEGDGWVWTVLTQFPSQCGRQLWHGCHMSKFWQWPVRLYFVPTASTWNSSNLRSTQLDFLGCKISCDTGVPNDGGPYITWTPWLINIYSYTVCSYIY